MAVSILPLVRLSLTGRVGWRLAERLRARFGGLDAVFRASEAALREIRGVGPVLARKILDASLEDRAKREIDLARKSGWEIDTPGIAPYPALLEETYDPPLILCRKGELHADDARALAIVGARRATPYGKRQAERFAAELADAGWTIVSGLARGIDTAAHAGCLKGGGRTIAVLGTGLDVPYPAENAGLLQEIASRGAVLTEFPRGTPPLRENFPRRNRVISGLARGVIVVEASERSGALITARWAIEENREVFALPGPVETGRSIGCHRLIREGAHLVERPADVLEAFGDPSGTNLDRPDPARQESGVDHAILELLRDGEMTIDDLGEAADLRPSELAIRLLRLEIAGVVRTYPGERIAISAGGAVT